MHRAADDAFAFVGRGLLNGEAGRLRREGGVVSGDLGGDGATDFEIEPEGSTGGPTPRGEDFPP